MNYGNGRHHVDRVREHTAPQINEKIDRTIEEHVRYYAARSRQELTNRIEELDREWDIERYLETSASSVGFLGIVLGVTRNRKWLLLTGTVLPFLFLHAVRGWCPPVPILRRLGIRTRKEIDREKFALKALRGDFGDINVLPETGDRALAAILGARL